MVRFDIGIKSGILLPMDEGQYKVQLDHFVGINQNKITFVGPWKNQSVDCAKFIDCSDHIVLPGLINGHTHLPMSLMRGLADDLPFEEWLFKNIFPTEAKLVDPSFVKCGTELAALELIKFGITTVCDMYYYSDVIAEVLDKAGIRAMIAQPLADFKTPDSETPSHALKRIEQLAKTFQGHPRISAAAGPHAPYTCGDETLKSVTRLAEKLGLAVSIHVSESKKEVETSISKFKKTPVQVLYDLGLMERGAIFAHCVHLSDSDIELMKSTKTSVIHNPESNMKLGSGAAPIVKYLKSGMLVGLGTDGAASNNNLNLFGEMDSAAKLQKLTLNDNAAITAYEVLKLATIGGAKALKLDEEIGSIEVGKRADLICVSTKFANMQPIHDPISQLVYSATGNEVEHVICDGKLLMKNFEITHIDQEKIFEEASSWVCRIDEAVG